MPECPEDCPNRRALPPSGRVHFGAYLFALLLSIFLGYQTWSHDRRDEKLPAYIWLPCTLLIGTSLGVRVDSSQLARLLSK